jgi:hypothetical protein
MITPPGPLGPTVFAPMSGWVIVADEPAAQRDLGLTRFRGLLSLGVSPLERSLDATSASAGVSG